MKILVFHPFGHLTDWNHRLARQVDLIGRRHDVRVMGIRPREFGVIGFDDIASMRDYIGRFKPNIVYVNGFMVANEAVKMFNKVVFDMGSCRARNVLIEDWGYRFPSILKCSVDELRQKFIHSVGETIYLKEAEAIDKASAIIIWEGLEADFVRKIYGNGEKIKEISMIFYNLPDPIKFEEKKKRVISVASKWGKKGKNLPLNLRVSKECKYDFMIVGSGGQGRYEFLSHENLMNEMNNSRVVFCPFYCGGIGTMVEAMRMGCNVVAYDWHPFSNYLNDDLIVKSGDGEIANGLKTIEMAMEKYYPLKKKLPTEGDQLNKILKVFEDVNKGIRI